ncbi:membrane hypothetical protein [Sulfurovum sp. enrichment culture clone C5]|uniref:Uncharacterized protein n=1 Tax=Sulfurovum sp. enrichment culture clone C5 TaxID=497650 RepID=A0A0S4XN66_9BACT|nr:membrane hypothetical protein [Sulfurovum sp. enrichment culture clone C5]
MKNLLFFGALPLVLYPFIAIASLMSLASPITGEEPILLVIVARAFQIASLMYPLVYFTSLARATSKRKEDEEIAIKIASIPLWFLMILGALLLLWIIVEKLFN